MIAMLRGRLIEADESGLVIDVVGVGYACQVSRRCLAKLGQVGDEVSVLVDTAVRDDRIVLTAFSDIREKRAWALLQTVQGVGTKAALAIISAIDPDELMLAIAAGDKAMITRAEGVGAKLAQRIINELSDKVATAPTGSTTGLATGSSSPQAGGVVADAVSALVNLGYSRMEAHQAASRIASASPSARLEDILPEALRQLGGTR